LSGIAADSNTLLRRAVSRALRAARRAEAASIALRMTFLACVGLRSNQSPSLSPTTFWTNAFA
jgi:hypothetical protein